MRNLEGSSPPRYVPVLTEPFLKHRMCRPLRRHPDGSL